MWKNIYVLLGSYNALLLRNFFSKSDYAFFLGRYLLLKHRGLPALQKQISVK